MQKKVDNVPYRNKAIAKTLNIIGKVLLATFGGVFICVNFLPLPIMIGIVVAHTLATIIVLLSSELMEHYNMKISKDIENNIFTFVIPKNLAPITKTIENSEVETNSNSLDANQGYLDLNAGIISSNNGIGNVILIKYNDQVEVIDEKIIEMNNYSVSI